MLARSSHCILLLLLVLFVITVAFKANSDKHSLSVSYYNTAYAVPFTTDTVNMQTYQTNLLWYGDPDEGIRIKHPSDLKVTEVSLSKSNVTELIEASDGPSIRDPNLKIEVIAQGLKLPTTMGFLGPDDILVLQKNDGTVRRVLNGTVLPDPVLDVNVANKFERGMLGIDILFAEQDHAKNRTSSNSSSSNGTYVFLYYTEMEIEGSDECPKPDHCVPGNTPLGNRVYRYEWDNTRGKLVNPVLLLDLPANPGPIHNGGKLVIGPDNNVYFIIGDLLRHRSASQNIPNATAYNGSSGIYRITPEGKSAHPIFSDVHPLDKYYAYGIRNSFGLDFDPVSGKLWDTENGPAFGDELNLVEPGFNSGWVRVQGFWNIASITVGEGAAGRARPNPPNLTSFGGKGNYSSPEFIWFNNTGPTALKFLNTDKLGNQYQNDLLIGDYHQGNIYHFKLNQNRTGLVLDGPLEDGIARFSHEVEEIKFGEGFGGITDLQVGPDGNLYVVSFGQGRIYKILSAD